MEPYVPTLIADSNKPPYLLRSDIRKWLGAPDPSINQNVASKKCHETTGSWFIHGSQFLYWKDRPNSFLLLHGFAGCGKTILCSTVINNIRKHTASLAQSVLAFYYLDFSNQIKAQASSCLRSIVLQLAQRSTNITALESLHRVYATSTPPTDELLEVLRHMLQNFRRAYIVVDALDECRDQEELLEIIETVRSWKMESLCILVTSRDEPDIRNALALGRDQEVPLHNSEVDKDIALSIAETLGKDPKLQEWSDIFPEIEASLKEGANGMFRWVECQFQTLRGYPSRAEVRRALNELPEDLDKTYERILRRVPQKYCDYALRVLQWLCIADEPVRVNHVMAAFAADIGDDPRIDLDSQFSSSEKVAGLCPGFIVTTYITKFDEIPRPCFQIAHYSVKEYLLSSRIPRPPDSISMFQVDRGLANLAMAKTCLTFALHPTALQFSHSATRMWPVFFREAKEEPQLTLLAVEYLTQNVYSLSKNCYHDAMTFASSEGLGPILSWLAEHRRAEMNISEALFRVCNSNYRSLKTVRFLVEHGADVHESHNIRDFGRGSRPLDAAARKHDVALVQALIHLGADPRQKNGFGTPLLSATQSGCQSLEIVKLLWCQDSWSSLDSDNDNALYWVAAERDYGPRTEEVAWWLIHHGVDPHNINNPGYTALHGAAEIGNETAIRVLLAAAGKCGGYDGCLTAYLLPKWNNPRLGTARQIFAVDPRPYGDSQNGCGALSSFLLARYHKVDESPECRQKCSYAPQIAEILLKYEQEDSFTRTDVYVQFCSVLLIGLPPNDCAIANWLAMGLKETDSAFFGMELWRAAVEWLSLYCHKGREAEECEHDGAVDGSLQMVRTLFEKREVFGVGITQLHRYLHQELQEDGNKHHEISRGRLWFAEFLIRQEPACVLAGLAENSNVGQGFRHLSGRPSHHAAKHGRLTVIKLMLNAGADPNEQDKNGDTTVFFALESSKRDKIIPFLLEHGCNINHQNQKGLTPLATAMSEGWASVDTLQLLSKEGCDMNLGDTTGRTPLMRAAAHGAFVFVAYLLDNGCDINVQDEEPGTSDVEDIEPDYYGWPKKIRPCGGHTALMYAVLFGHVDVVRLLLNNGCNKDLQNNEGNTAMDLARRWEEDEIVELFEDHGSGISTLEGYSAETRWVRLNIHLRDLFTDEGDSS